MSLQYSEDLSWSGQENMALQKYLLLQSQHESVQEYLDQLRTSTSSTAAASTSTSPSLSPTRESSSSRKHSRSSHHGRSLPPPSRRGHALETVVDETTMYEIAAQEQQLYAVNEALKRSLTELLNSDAVRADRAYRNWVQSRLMEVEKSLRSGRRRRSH